jgi:hypothetical protein
MTVASIPRLRRRTLSATELARCRRSLASEIRDANLTSPKQVEAILKRLRAIVLDGHGYPMPDCFSDLTGLRARVVASELYIQGRDLSGTRGWHFRDPRHREGYDRLKLHAQIIESLLTKPRPKNDADVTIDAGGGLPPDGAEAKSVAYLVTGLPACGKSTIVRDLFVRTRSLVVDPDDAKRMLPEYRDGKNAIALHEESSVIAKGLNGLMDCAMWRGFNIISPTIGATPARLLDVQQLLRKNGYTVALIYVHCPPEIAAVRSLHRLMDDGRYVPLSLIFGAPYANPESAYRTLKQNDGWAGWARFDVSAAGSAPHLDEIEGLAVLRR